MSEFHRILKSADPKLLGWRVRVSAECPHECDVAEEIVHDEQVDNPGARHTKRRELLRLTRAEATWLRDALTAWLEACPDSGKICGLLDGEEICSG